VLRIINAELSFFKELFCGNNYEVLFLLEREKGEEFQDGG
jgi:hypothetical protein